MKNRLSHGCGVGPGHLKIDKVPGGGIGSSVEWIAPQKVAVFKTLFDRIREHIGSYDGARKFCGLSSGIMDTFEKGKLSATQAKKILAAYQKIPRSA